VRFRLTDAGYARAAETSARCSYSGAAPVTLRLLDAIQHHSIHHTSVTKADVTAAFLTWWRRSICSTASAWR
jgi:hypothetical protein